MQTKRVRTVVNLGNSNGDAFSGILTNRPSCRIATKSMVFGNRGVLRLRPRRQTATKIFLTFRCPLRVPKIDGHSFLQITCGTRHGTENRRRVSMFSFSSLLSRQLKIMGVSTSFLSHDIGRNFSNNRGGHGRVLRVTLLRPALTVLSRASSKLSVSTLGVITGNIGRLTAPSGTIILVARCRQLLSCVIPSCIRIVTRNHVVAANNGRLTLRLRSHNCR